MAINITYPNVIVINDNLHLKIVQNLKKFRDFKIEMSAKQIVEIDAKITYCSTTNK